MSGRREYIVAAVV